ncbi:glycosyltransferase family 4 protein [Aestuariivivens sediminis]|uniref:glycosyltransferase family 4 protein n=1 Tax=Aestuariivivens sediminis TaxID=2913557 RepID=UPI001F570270|nr:glycosyltransferase family 4 protein [Aestuariivivens sediminis]
MKHLLKISVYSGAIPSTTFIEHLIKGIATKHQVFLFGSIKSRTAYNNPKVRIYGHYKNRLINLIISLWRLVLLAVLYPRRIKVLKHEILKQYSRYAKYQHFIKILPVLLHLPDIFHIQWAKDLEPWFFLKEHLNVKLIVSLRGAHINYSPITNAALAKSYQSLFPKVDGFHAVSEAIAKEAQKYNAPEEKIEVIHSLLPKTTLQYFEGYKKRNPKQIHLVSVGRFHWKKGYRYALDALKLLKDRGVNVNYTIISSNCISEEILFQIHQLDLVEEVRILNGLPQHQLFGNLKTYDCFILPSLEEGIANVVLEAMALGVPVISTNCGGMAEVVIPNETGWLVPVRDHEALAEAVQELIHTSEAELQHIVLNAHDFVKKNFNAEKSIAQFLALYERVMD